MFGGLARSSRVRGGSVTYNIPLRFVSCELPLRLLSWSSHICCQSSAEAALELNGTDMEEGHKMSVYISNPERKKERTDSDANDREIYVAGLSKFVIKQDLITLFKTVSRIAEYILE